MNKTRGMPIVCEFYELIVEKRIRAQFCSSQENSPFVPFNFLLFAVPVSVPKNIYLLFLEYIPTTTTVSHAL